MKSGEIRRMTLAAMFVALGVVLPQFIGRIPEIGMRLLPMHLPVLLCGFICGWKWGLATGLLVPLLNSLLFGRPALMPNAVAMMAELATYGAVAGWLYPRVQRWMDASARKGADARRWLGILLALVGAMLAGRIVWGLAMYVLGTMGKAFTLQAFWGGAFVNAVPGILVQVVLIPLVILALEKAKLIPLRG